nr:hypothetical protein [Pseudomonadota bacterium]
MFIKRLSNSRSSLAGVAFSLTFLAGLSAPGQSIAASGIVELSPTPPNVTQAVAPNIVVTFDDSGSMASNYMGDNRPFDGGSWSGPWFCAGLIDPRVTDTSNILSKAMNGVYYNPNVLYTPPVKADGTTFPEADATLAAVPLDGIGINRPHLPQTADLTAAYNNNPNGTNDPSGLTDLTGTFSTTNPNLVTTYATFGTSCAANADAGSCSNSNNSGTSGSGSNKRYVYYINGDTGSSGNGTGTVYYGAGMRVRNSSSGGYTMVAGDKTSVSPAVTKKYSTWTVTTNPSVTVDNRWECGYGSSPMDGVTTGPDGTVYPNGGPYYYRYKTTAPTIAVDAYGNPTSAGAANLYTKTNWEAVAVPNTTVTINGKSVNQWQNFANWYAYYRTRNLMTRTALSRVFGSLGSDTDTGGYGNSIRAAWQNINDGNFKLPSTAIITSLIDAAGCNATSVDPRNTQRSGAVKVSPDCYRSAFFNWIFQVKASGGTPNRASTIRAGEFFQRGNGNTGGTGNLLDPYWQAPTVSGADGLELVCRQNYQMLVTDGYWNEGDPGLPNPFKTSQAAVTGNLPDGTVYSASTPESRVYWDVQDSVYTSSLANIAFNYWATNLRPDLYNVANGKVVPPYMPDSSTGVVSGATSELLEKFFNPNNDPANWPHLVQYMVTLGVPGNLTYSADADCVDSTNDLCRLRRGQTNSSGSTGWTRPINNNPAAIDDTWHAAVNSRGAYFNAANPQNLVDQLTNILTNISARNVPATTSALNTSVLVQGALGFTAGYSSGDWSGVFQAITANGDGTVSGLQWDAGVILTDASKTVPNARQILTSKENADGSFNTGAPFRTFASDLDNLTPGMGSSYVSAQTLLSESPPPPSGISADSGQARMDYLRGVRTLEGATYRTRSSLLGAIINSQAIYVGAPSSGYRNNWPATSSEALAMTNDSTTCDPSA